MKPGLLFLCHRFPYPPDKGDKIRSFHILRFLSERYRVFLGAFVDDERDWEHAPKLKCWCEESKLLRLAPHRARLRSLIGLVRGEPMTLPYYRSAEMAEWVDEVVRREGLSRILVFSSSMAQYAMDPELAPLMRVIDFVDVDSDKWGQYAERKFGPERWLYRREGRRLLAYERTVASQFRRSFFVSAAEAALFRSLAPEAAQRVDVFSNGVDPKRFSPALDLPTPYGPDEQALVFTGAMDYWPNADAAVWFAEAVFPQVRARRPKACFYIVGRNPTPAVRRLAHGPGVVVTGAIPDVRPHVRHAVASVAPLRVARGIQNKVLEAMAMAKVVIATPAALEGIDAVVGREVLVADGAETFATQTLLALGGGLSELGQSARERVMQDFSWDAQLPRLVAALEGEGLGAGPLLLAVGGGG